METTFRNTFRVKYKYTSNVRRILRFNTVTVFTFDNFSVLYKFTAAGHERCTNTVREKSLTSEKKETENWGGEKKPVLISCGLVFHAESSTERERGCSCGLERSVKPKQCYSHYLFFIISILAYFLYTSPSCFDPLLFPFISLSLSFPHVELELHQNVSAH